MGLFGKIKEGLRKTRNALGGAINGVIANFRRVDEEFFEELEEVLITCDVGAATAGDLCEALRRRVKEENIKDPEEIRGLLKSEIADMLRGDNAMELTAMPSLIWMIGVNGAGKTTTVGKLAALYRSEGKKVIVGAADTFRAAATEQLEVWTDRAGVDLVRGETGGDPAAVVFDTISAGKARGCDVIICDTAGRLHNKKSLMDELAKIRRVIERELPGGSTETLLVLDATTGQNAVNQAREFLAATGVTGIVLTKLDGTARGGVVLTIKRELGLPVKFIGVGEGIDDLQPFDPDAFAEALFEGGEDER